MSGSSYIIVGSGVFGASTALYLIRKYPNSSITLIDRDSFNAPYRVAASWDWNKVIRADYSDITYTKLGLEAQQLWRTDPIWQRFYHESGVAWISPTSFAEQVLKNFDQLGVKADIKGYSVEDARGLYDGLFEDADYTNVKQVLVNRSSGWAEAKEALQSTIATAVGLGVDYVTAEVTAVDLEGKRCCGVMVSSGGSIKAERVILCTGAFTPKLLMNSAPEWQDFHGGGRIIAAGVAEALGPLTAEQRPIPDRMPVIINDNPTENGCDLGCLPLPSINTFKYWGQTIFRNTLQHTVTGSPLSMPPIQSDYAQWDVPQALKSDVQNGPNAIFGKKHFNQELENFRICWEALTPSKDFIISPHSACDGLYVATCGSFHGFKFLPILGKYVSEMLDGELEPGLQKRWAWDRDLTPTEKNKHWPWKELKDLFNES